jgi:hypothetical protein
MAEPNSRRRRASTRCWCGISTNRAAAYLCRTVGTVDDTKRPIAAAAEIPGQG